MAQIFTFKGIGARNPSIGVGPHGFAFCITGIHLHLLVGQNATFVVKQCSAYGRFACHVGVYK